MNTDIDKDKFDNQPAYVPYYWDNWASLIEDYIPETETLVFAVSESERARFPELKDRTTVYVYKCKGGFIYEIPEWAHNSHYPRCPCDVSEEK